MRSYDGLGIKLGYPTIHRVVGNYFHSGYPVVLTIMTIGAPHRYHNFINDNINSSQHFKAKCFDHITVILQPNTGAEKYIY